MNLIDMKDIKVEGIVTYQKRNEKTNELIE